MKRGDAPGPDVGPTVEGCCAHSHSPGDPVAGPAIGRRRLLQAGGVVAASMAALGSGARSAGASSPAGPGTTALDAPRNWPRRGARVTLLGTRAGPPPVDAQAGISSAVTVDGTTYLVDCGRNSVSQYQRAGLRYTDLGGIFLTHLHADHISDYYNYFLLAGTSVDGNEVPAGVPVHGPGSAGALSPAAGGVDVDTINPDAPTPGTVAMTQSCHGAYAYSSNTFRRAAPRQIRDIRTLVEPHDIALPVGSAASGLGDTAPPTDPFTVMEDDRVKVTATLVPHGTVFPAFAFRFDSDYGSVTFSGDTRVSDNLVALARSSTLLVHEAISLPPTGLPQGLVDYQLSLHATVDQVGAVAQRADVENLVLSHLIDFATPGTIDMRSWTRRARSGYSGRAVIGRDLQVFPARRR